MSDPVTAGRGWARFGFGVGVIASITANVAHGYIPPAGAGPDWAPSYGAIATAAFWPVALVISVEVISRVNWPEGNGWKWLRFGGVSLVAAIAAVISYQHLHGLLTAYGETGIGALIGPLAVDGLMAVCSGALVALSRARREQAVIETASEPDAVLASPDRNEIPASVPAAPVRPSRPRRPARRTEVRHGDRSDEELLALLATVPRKDDGTVPVRTAREALGVGTDRASRLLLAAGLLASKSSAPVDAVLAAPADESLVELDQAPEPVAEAESLPTQQLQTV